MTTANRYPDRPQVGDKIETVLEPSLPGEVVETHYATSDHLTAIVSWPDGSRSWEMEASYKCFRVTERAR